MTTMTRTSESTVTSTCLLLAFELGERKWKVGFTTGFGQAPRIREIPAGAVDQLLDEIRRAKTKLHVAADAPVISCYEAGRDGFWLHRYLLAHDITNYVVDSSSIEVNRKARRAKTDRLDLGGLLTLLARYRQGREQFQLALAARQVPPEVRFRYAVFYLLPLGRVREALDSIERAVEQDPLNVVFRGAFAMVLSSESPDRAVAEARKAIEIDQRHWLPYYAMSMNHFRLGELPEARRLAERSTTAAPWMPLPKGLLAGLQRRLGENESADALLSKLQSPSGKFIYHMVCSEIDAGADSFTKAIAQGEVQPLMWFGAADFLRPLRSSPRWSALAKIMNLPTEAAGN